MDTLIVDHGTDGRLRTRRGGRVRHRKGPARSGIRTFASSDSVPRPHRVLQVMADPRVAARAPVTRCRECVDLVWIEPALEPLPLRPQPIDVGMEHEEEGIPDRHVKECQVAVETVVRGRMRSTFDRPEARELVTDSALRKRLCFADYREVPDAFEVWVLNFGLRSIPTLPSVNQS